MAATPWICLRDLLQVSRQVSRLHRASAYRMLPFDFASDLCARREPRPVAAMRNRAANRAYLSVLDHFSFRLGEQRRQASYSLGGVVL
jgi:hypothetical protein